MSADRGRSSLHIWWLASRAAGVVALGLITTSVMLGLAMANKLLRGRNYAAIHEHLSVAGLVAILAHGVTLLGDSWLHPGLVGIAVPFTMGYRTVFTGLGIMAGYLAAALGLSFYARKRIGARLWRKAHRFTPVVYLLALGHTLGAGTDASTPWLRTFMRPPACRSWQHGRDAVAAGRSRPRSCNRAPRASRARARPAPEQPRTRPDPHAPKLLGVAPGPASPLVMCYDGSENSRHAIDEAARLHPGARAIVLHVWESIESTSPTATRWPG